MDNSNKQRKAIDIIKKYLVIAISFSEKLFMKIIPEYLKNTFKFHTTKASKYTGIIFAFVLMIAVVALNNSFVKQEYAIKWFLLAIAMLLPILIGLLIAFKIEIKDTITKKALYIAAFFLLPILTITMSECLNSIWIYDMTYLGFFGNYTIVLLLYLFVFSLSGSLRITILCVNPPVFGLALAHAYLVAFRGTPFIPMDVLGITTAMNVGSTYDYTPSDIIVLGSLIFIIIIVIGFKIKTPDYNRITKSITRIFSFVFFTIIVCLFYLTSIFADAGIKPDFWNQSRGYRNYGFVYNFICNTKYLYMSEPTGYNPNEVSDYVSKKVTENTADTNNAKTPNIICIMNESLSDLSVLGNFTTNEDYMPFIRNLTENTVKGNLYVPVIGAGTSNTEFEFLTGHSTAFLPSGSNAFMLYIKNPLATLVSTLESQGYSSLAFHPYYASGWNRVNVYKNMGFNSFKSLENLIDISIMNEYTQNNANPDYLQQLINERYPNRSNMLIRQYISDQYDYSVLIEDYENRDKSQPYFVFNVTMQNHGGYTTSASNFLADIQITSTENQYNKATNYLSLVKKSDNAFKELVEYFSNVKEPTVICMFGDHQPSIETKFISEVMGVGDLSNLTIEQEQARHITPFIIWANYDIKEKTVEKLSVNYLSSYVLDIAGVKLTKYNKYLLKLSETLPVIDTVGYIDNQNNYYKWSSSSTYNKILKEYEQIQYNNIFDYENNDTDTFFINNYSVEEIAKSIEETENEDEDSGND